MCPLFVRRDANYMTMSKSLYVWQGVSTKHTCSNHGQYCLSILEGGEMVDSMGLHHGQSKCLKHCKCNCGWRLRRRYKPAPSRFRCGASRSSGECKEQRAAVHKVKTLLVPHLQDITLSSLHAQSDFLLDLPRTTDCSKCVLPQSSRRLLRSQSELSLPSTSL